MRIIPVEPSEKMRLNVQSEVNYLEYPRDDHLGPDYEDCIQFDCLLRMLSETHERFQYHYLETFSAWNRMRAQLGRAPYPWEKFLDRDEYDHTHGIRPRSSESKDQVQIMPTSLELDGED